MTNRSDHDMIVDGAIYSVRTPRGETVKPRFPAYISPTDEFDFDNKVDAGETFAAPTQPFGLGDWMEQFPLYSKQEPRVRVLFDWRYEHQDDQERCVDARDRTVPVGERPLTLSRTPWVIDARLRGGRLEATVRSCAGDEKEVFDASRFSAESPDGDTVDAAATRGPIKVPLAASQCRDVTVTFASATSRDWVITHPYFDENVPLKWTLSGPKVRGGD